MQIRRHAVSCLSLELLDNVILETRNGLSASTLGCGRRQLNGGKGHAREGERRGGRRCLGGEL